MGVDPPRPGPKASSGRSLRTCEAEDVASRGTVAGHPLAGVAGVETLARDAAETVLSVFD